MLSSRSPRWPSRCCSRRPRRRPLRVFGEDDDGDQTVSLSVGRDGLTTAYLVPAKITAHSIKARFGSLGALDFEFRTTPGTRECRGLLTFSGSFTFAGEGGYVHVDSHHAHGVFVERSYTACPPPGQAPKITEVSTRVHLEAIAGAPHADGSRTVSVSEYRRIGDDRRRVRIDAYLLEELEGMKIAHGASVTVDSSSVFHRNFEGGVATLRPPAPFTGYARMLPGRPIPTKVWVGELAVPRLGGGEPIGLAGPDFRVHLVKERPVEE